MALRTTHGYPFKLEDALSGVHLLLATTTAGIQSTRSLKEAIERYKTRDSNLRRFLGELR